MPKVSVIVPVYNVEPYLRECLDSVINQTMRDIEILCVFAHSSDNSERILEEYAARDVRITLINRNDGGLAEARNVGMRVANGEYISFLDSDDIWSLQTCERTYEAAKAADADMAMFYFDCFGEMSKQPPPRTIFEETIVYDNLQKLKIEHANWHTAWCNVYRNSFLRQHELRFHYGLIFEDLPFVTKAALAANKLLVLPEVLQMYRQRESSQMRQSRLFFQRINAFNKMLEDVAPLDLSEPVQNWLYRRKFDTLFYTAAHVGAYAEEYQLRIKDDLSRDQYRAIRDRELGVSEEARLFYISLMSTKLDYAIEYSKYAVWNAPRLVKGIIWRTIVSRSSFLRCWLRRRSERRMYSY